MTPDTIRVDKYENALVDISKSINPLLLKAEALTTIKTSYEMTKASDILTTIKRRLNRTEEVRIFFTKPLNDHVKRINAGFKETSVPLAKAERLVKDKIATYVMEAKRKRLEEEKKLQEKVEKLNKNRKNKLPQPIVADVQSTFEGKNGRISTSKTWAFEITRPKMIPREYLEVDEQAIRQAIRNGVRKIAGIKIFEKEVVSVHA